MTTYNKKFGNHPRKGIETTTGEGKTTNNKKFGNDPRKRIETTTGQRKTTNNKKFGNHSRKGIRLQQNRTRISDARLYNWTNLEYFVHFKISYL